MKPGDIEDNPKRRGRHKRLLDDPDVKRWYENMARGSRLTADVRLRRLGLYCERTNTTPAKFARIGADNVRDVEDMMLDYVSLLEREGRTPSYIGDILKTLKSWLQFNYVKLVRKIRIKNADIPVTLENEQVPSPERYAELLDAAPSRTRVSISLVGMSGLRLGVLGNHDGTDGLRLSDVADLRIMPGGADAEFLSMPARVTVRAKLSKAGHQYFTYLPELGCRYLLGYLRERIASGERLTGDSAVIAFKRGYQNRCPKRNHSRRNSQFLTTKAVSRDIKKAFGVIIRERPYVLRSYFDTQLLMAESRGLITHAYRQFFMGHKGDIEARYTTNKRRLSEQLMQDMREAYRRSQSFLVPGGGETPADEEAKKKMFLEMWKEHAKMYGIDPARMRIERQRDSDAQPTLADEIEAIRSAIKGVMTGGAGGEPVRSGGMYEGRIVNGEDELLPYIEDGWSIVRELDGGRIVLRKRRADGEAG